MLGAGFSWRGAIAILLLATSPFAGPVFAQTRPGLAKVTLTMGGDGLQFLTQHIALRGGFFAEEGLDAQTLDVGSGPRQVAALMGGSSEFSALGLIHVIKANAEGAKLVAISTEFDVLDIQLVLSNDAVRKSGIVDGMPLDERIKRLAGLRISISSPGSSTDTYLRSLLRFRGHDPDKSLSIVPTGGGSNMLAALEKGATDGFAWGAPQSQTAVARGVGKIVVNPFTGEVPEIAGVPYLVIVTSRQTLEQKPDIIRRGVRAFARAMKLARDKPEEARALVRAHFADIDEAVFERAWQDYRKGIPPSPVINPQQLEKTAAWLNITAQSKVTATYTDLIAPEFAREAAAEILGK